MASRNAQSFTKVRRQLWRGSINWNSGKNRVTSRGFTGASELFFFFFPAASLNSCGFISRRRRLAWEINGDLTPCSRFICILPSRTVYNILVGGRDSPAVSRFFAFPKVFSFFLPESDLTWKWNEFMHKLDDQVNITKCSTRAELYFLLDRQNSPVQRLEPVGPLWLQHKPVKSLCASTLRPSEPLLITSLVAPLQFIRSSDWEMSGCKQAHQKGYYSQRLRLFTASVSWYTVMLV